MFQVTPLPRTLDAARRDLASPKQGVRADAARDLGHQGQVTDLESRIDLLAGALVDPSALVRKTAVVALADLEARRVLPELLALFADPDLRVRQMAVLAVGELARDGDREVEGRLLGLTRAGDPAIRFQALAGLAGLVGAGAREEILAAAHDPDPEIRELSVRLSAQHLGTAGEGGAAVEQLLRDLAKDPAARVALAAEIEGLALGLDLESGHLHGLLAGVIRPAEATDERRAILLVGELGLALSLPVLRKRAFGWFGLSLDPYRWPIRATLARLGDERAARSIERGVRGGRWLTRTLAVEAAGVARLAALRPSLQLLLGRGELVDQEVLEQALSVLPDVESAGQAP